MATRIGLLGLYASRNLGDAAIQLAVIGNLRQRFGDAEFVGICPDPEDTRATFGIDSVNFAGQPSSGEAASTGRLAALVPWRIRTTLRRAAELPGVRRCISGLDLLVLSGGGQLDEFWGGPWNHPLQLYVWTHLARRRGVPVAALGLGLDVLESRAARYLCVSAIRAASVRAYRDTGTARAMEGFGMRAPHVVIPDLAFALEAPAASTKFAAPDDSPLIAVAAISGKALSGKFAAAHGAYLAHLAAACRQWIEEGARLRFVCSQPTMDLPVIESLIGLLPQPRASGRYEIAETPTVDEYMQAVRGASFLVASRLHGLILAFLVGCPAVAIAGNRKVTQLMQDIGMAPFTLGMDALTPGAIERVAAPIPGGRASLAEAIGAYNAGARAALARVFDEIAGLVRPV